MYALSYTFCSIIGLFNDELFFFGLALFVSRPDQHMCVIFYLIVFFSSFGPVSASSSGFFRGSISHSYSYTLFVIPLCYLCVTFVSMIGAMYAWITYWMFIEPVHCTPYTVHLFFPTATHHYCRSMCYLEIFTAGFKRLRKKRNKQSDKINVSLYWKMWNLIQWNLLLFAIRAFVCV